MTSLDEKLLILHQCFDDARIPHAFGGAIALAYCIADPRGTVDLDINVFVTVDQARSVLSALPDAIRVTQRHVKAVEQNAQVRMRWDETPIDLFFNDHEFHVSASARVRTVPFAQREIPVLDCTDLAILKAIFNRPKDWMDIELADDIGAIDHTIAATWIAQLEGTEGFTYRHLASIFEGKRGEEAEPRPFPFT